MAAFDARRIQETGIAADHGTTREHQFGQGLRRAVVQRARAVAQALAAFDVRLDAGVGLPALHFFERAHPGVLVVQTDHEAQRDLVAFEVVQEAAAEGVVVHGPAGGMHHQAGLGFVGRHFPEFLDANGEGLGVLAFIQLVLGDQLLAQVAACALGEHGVLRVQFHADLEALHGLAVLAHAEIAGGHTFDGAIVVVEHFRSGEAGENFHAQGLGLFAQPFGDRAQADDVAAVVVKVARHQPVGCAGGAGFTEHQQVVAGDGLVQRGAALFPVGEEFGDGPGVHDRAREDVGAGLGAFLQHADIALATLFGGELLQADGGGQAGRAAAHNDHVVFHCFTRAVGAEDLFGGHGFGLNLVGLGSTVADALG